MLQLAWLKAKGNNRQQERLAAILHSHRVQELLDGTLDVLQWPERPWLWVSVELILLLYEGVAEAVDGNFVSNVSCLLAHVNDTTVLSVHEADQNMERLLLPLKQNFTTLGNFLNYMLACVQAAIIERMASLDTPEGKAWDKEHNKLIKLHQETSTLTLDMVQQVVKLAENHLTCINIPSRGGVADSAVTSALSTDTTSVRAGLEEQVNMQASMISTLEERLSEISAQVEREQEPTLTKGGRSSAGGKTQRTGLKRPFKAGQTPADKIKSKAPATPCTTCCKLHRGKCIHLRNLDKEQEELDRAHKLKAAITEQLL
eukprot:3292502-Rhodomonas_salina.1